MTKCVSEAPQQAGCHFFTTPVNSFMFWRRFAISLLCLLALAIPIEHKYDKLFRFFSLKLIPDNVVLPNFFDKKIYFYPSDIITLALILIAIFALRIPLRRLFLSRGAIFLWIIFLFALISIRLSPLASYPIPYIRLLNLATPFLLFCFLANAFEGEDKLRLSSILLGCLVITALVQSGIAIAQYAIQGPLGLRLLSEPKSFASFTVPSGSLWLFGFHSNGEPLSVIRASGTFPHANVLGGFLTVSILAAYSFFSMPRFRLFAALAIPVQFFALCLTFSRSALFSWMLGTLVWLCVHLKKHRIQSMWKDPSVRLVLCAIGGTLLFSTVVLYEQISKRGGIINYNQLARGSDALRISYQNVALQVIKDSPLSGSGFQQLSIRGIDYKTNDPNYPQAGAAHNIYLYLAAETGLFSLASFFLFLLFLLWTAIKSPFSPALASLSAIFVAYLFIGCCDFYPLLFQQGKIPFFLTAGLLAAYSCKRESSSIMEAA